MESPASHPANPAVEGERSNPAAGAGPPVGPPVRPARRRGYFLPGAIAMAALLVIGAILGAGDLQHPAPRSLVGPEIADQIALGIQAVQNTRQAPAVTCPPSEPVRQGLRFTCSMATHGGGTATIYVTEIDGRGRVRWSLQPG